MKRLWLMAVLLSAASSALLAAQLYRWVDENGRVEWRDTPPPATAKKVEQRKVEGSTIQTSSLPYSVQQAVRNFPVTLWVAGCGAPCDQARAHLARRGVPYTEKDPQQDVELFRKATGGDEIPVIFVGRTRIRGYLEAEWDSALDTAGYPRTAITSGGKPLVKPTVAPPPSPEAQPRQAAGQPEGQPAAK